MAKKRSEAKQASKAAEAEKSESSLKRWLKDKRITEVECLVPDITGNARGARESCRCACSRWLA